jgi:hypothetical protein
MQNGSIGEARTRAFLIDRFWILERSVDVDGADFIIQKQVTSRNLLDRSPPRFGVVQVKFFQNENTTQYVHAEYVLDQHGNPRGEFFVLCHTGAENDPRKYLIPADEVARTFKRMEEGHTHAGKFCLPGKEVLIPKYEVTIPSRALDRIEHALDMADFRSNREFLLWAAPSLREERAAIRPEFKASLPNNWGNIEQTFKELKRNAGYLGNNIEEALDLLRQIQATDDPVTAMQIVERLHYEYGNPLSFSSDLHNEDFQAVSEQRKRLYDSLREVGAWDPYLEIQANLTAWISREVGARMPLPPEGAVVLTLHYDPNTLINPQCDFQFCGATDLPRQLLEKTDDWNDTSVGIISSRPGEIIAYWMPGRYGYYSADTHKQLPPDANWPEELENHVDVVTQPMLNEVYKQRFPELIALGEHSVRDGIIKAINRRELVVDIGVHLDAILNERYALRKSWRSIAERYKIGEKIRVEVLYVELPVYKIELRELPVNDTKT